jgi:hypothetical protein
LLFSSLSPDVSFCAQHRSIPQTEARIPILLEKLFHSFSIQIQRCQLLHFFSPPLPSALN